MVCCYGIENVERGQRIGRLQQYLHTLRQEYNQLNLQTGPSGSGTVTNPVAATSAQGICSPLWQQQRHEVYAERIKKLLELQIQLNLHLPRPPIARQETTSDIVCDSNSNRNNKSCSNNKAVVGSNTSTKFPAVKRAATPPPVLLFQQQPSSSVPVVDLHQQRPISLSHSALLDAVSGAESNQLKSKKAIERGPNQFRLPNRASKNASGGFCGCDCASGYGALTAVQTPRGRREAFEQLRKSRNKENEAKLTKMLDTIEASVAELAGRLHFDIKAILAFARVTVGDAFEVHIRHGQNQRWKCRGKVQPDKSQKWDQHTTVFSLDLREPIEIKVYEVKFLKLVKLNQRFFDPLKFVAAQPQLVTMNLNNIGSIKLQLIVTWIPAGEENALELSQGVPHSSSVNGGGSINSNSQSSAGDTGSSSNRSSPMVQLKSGDSSPPFHKLNGLKKKGDDSTSSDYEARMNQSPKTMQPNGFKNHANNDMRDSPLKSIIADNGLKSPEKLPPLPKICLREKKRQREEQQQQQQYHQRHHQEQKRLSVFADKQSWRQSSTSMLDDVYKAVVAQGTPTVDDLTVLKSLHRSPSSVSHRQHHQPTIGEFNNNNHRRVSSSDIAGETRAKRKHSLPRRFFSFIKPGKLSSGTYYNNTPEAYTINGVEATDADFSAEQRRELSPGLLETAATKSSKQDWRKSASLSHIQIPRDELYNNDDDEEEENGESFRKDDKMEKRKSTENKGNTSYASVNGRTSAVDHGGGEGERPSTSADHRKSQRQNEKGIRQNGISKDASSAVSGQNQSPAQNARLRQTQSVLPPKYNDNAKSIPSRPPIAPLGGSNSPGPAPSPTRKLSKLGGLVKKHEQYQRQHQQEPPLYYKQRSKSSLAPLTNGSIGCESTGSKSSAEGRNAETQLEAPLYHTPIVDRRSNGLQQHSSALYGKHYQHSQHQQQQSSMERINELLALIEAIRQQLNQLCRNGNYPELDRFEAAMLQFEALLKLSRSGLLEANDSEGRISSGNNKGIKRTGSQLSRRQYLFPNNNTDNNATSSYYKVNQHHQQLCRQHSPSSGASDEQQMGGPPVNFGEQLSENDSGIDSLRQYASPYCVFHARHSSSSQQHPPSATGSVEMDATLKQHLCRALAVLRDAVRYNGTPLNYPVEKALLQVDQEDTLALEFLFAAHRDGTYGQPEALLASIGALFQELETDPAIQEIWFAVCRAESSAAVNALLIPTDELRRVLQQRVLAIVAPRYPDLINNVLDSLMSLFNIESFRAIGKPPEYDHFPQKTESSDPAVVTCFQLLGAFAGKRFRPFVESLSHEAWISTQLRNNNNNNNNEKTSEEHSDAVREVMNRLGNVPVSPPLGTLRHIAWVLGSGSKENVINSSEDSGDSGKRTRNNTVHFRHHIERYLKRAVVGSNNRLADDLAESFLCLLAYNDTVTRVGACRALAILKKPLALPALEYLSREDATIEVRAEANAAVQQIRRQKVKISESSPLGKNNEGCSTKNPKKVEATKI